MLNGSIVGDLYAVYVNNLWSYVDTHIIDKKMKAFYYSPPHYIVYEEIDCHSDFIYNWSICLVSWLKIELMKTDQPRDIHNVIEQEFILILGDNCSLAGRYILFTFDICTYDRIG